MNIFKILIAKIVGDQTSEIGGDGATGIATQFIAPLGFLYRPKSSQLTFGLPIEGDTSNIASICPQPNQNVISLEEGESAVGNFTAGCYMIFKNDGTIIVNAKKIIQTADVDLTGNINQTGLIESTGTHKAEDFLTNNGKQFLLHTHGGVRAGGDTTGGPS